jgi:hypothetical protein
MRSSEPDTSVCGKMLHLHSEDAELWCAPAVLKYLKVCVQILACVQNG